jgi:hypothetical protein
MGRIIIYETLSGSDAWFDEDHVPPPHRGPIYRNLSEQHVQAVLYVVGEFYVGGFVGGMRLPPLKRMEPNEALRFCRDRMIDPPRELLVAVRATTNPANVIPKSTTPTQPKPETLGAGAEPPRNSATNDDCPDPDMFRAYHASTRGARQTAIAEELQVSQPTIHRYIKKVEAWIAAGNKLPGLDESPKPDSRPRMISVDPAKMGRFTEDDDE